ncbi:MAG: hypothetical protein COA90_07425 [Gammaproteobacteria bacterium]|nr:MAG: hypothetical protein COA90_07425 [Gammaproteobacteria bacterium]
MKKLNSLTILLIVTAIMVALMLMTIQRPSSNSDDEGLLFPELKSQLSNIDTIHIKSNQDDFTLIKSGEDWLIKERWNFPADFNLVKRALIDLSDAKILERKTAKAEQYPILGVEGTDDGGQSIQLTLSNGDEQFAGFILGRERELGQTGGARQFYVRRVAEKESWLAEGYLNLTPLMLNWIDSEVINIARERIVQVNIIQPNGQRVTLINLGKKDKFGTPTEREKTVYKYDLLGYDIAGTLFQLRMEDVQPRDEFSRDGAEVVKAEFITFDGLKMVVSTSFDNDKGLYNSTFKAEQYNSALPRVPNDIQASGMLKTAEQVEQEVLALNKELSPWVYRFGGFIGTNLMRARADVVTEIEKVIPMPVDMTGGFGS